MGFPDLPGDYAGRFCPGQWAYYQVNLPSSQDFLEVSYYLGGK